MPCRKVFGTIPFTGVVSARSEGLANAATARCSAAARQPAARGCAGIIDDASATTSPSQATDSAWESPAPETKAPERSFQYVIGREVTASASSTSIATT